MSIDNQSTFERQAEPLDDKLVGSKWAIARGILIDDGHPNLVSSLNILYDSLYFPDQVVSRYDIPGDDRYPERKATLADRTYLPVADPPRRIDFVSELRDSLTSGGEVYAEVLESGAKEALRTMRQLAPIMLWTEGDMYGYSGSRRRSDGSLEPADDQSSLLIRDVAGSREQLAKILRSDLVELARYALPSELQSEQHQLTWLAREDKFDIEAIELIQGWLDRQQASRVIVIEDQLANIDKLRSRLGVGAEDLIGIRVMQGRHAQTDGDSAYEAASISEVGPVLSELTSDGARAVIICDVDGVLINQERLVDSQGRIITEQLKSRGWL